MNKEIEKLLFNPIRLKIISFLITVEYGNFNALIEITDASKGNLSIQLKKLNEAKLIKIKKYLTNRELLSILNPESKMLRQLY